MEARVYCEHCQDFHLVDEVECLNIEEDIQGRDLITFLCPETDKTVVSLVTVRR